MHNRNPITKQAIKRIIALGIRGHNAKDVARRVGSSPRTICNWSAEATEPSASQLVALMREYDAIYEAVLFMAGRKAATLTDNQLILIRQAIDLLGTAIPANATPIKQEPSTCRQSSFPFIAGQSQAPLSIPRLATYR